MKRFIPQGFLLAAFLNAAVLHAAPKVTAISAGGGDGLFIESDGSLWGMGWNGDGQLGDGTKTDRYKPTKIVSSNVIVVAAGDGFSLFLKKDGSLWGMGRNGEGQLGDGTTNEHLTPFQIVASNVTAIAAEETHGIFLKKDGSLWGMGDNEYGQMRDRATMNILSPADIAIWLKVWMGNGITKDILSPADITVLLEEWMGDGATMEILSPRQIVAGNVTAISAGDGFSLFLKKDGSMWAIGNNTLGQFGDGTTKSQNIPVQIVPSGVIAIAAGGAHTLFLKSDGSLWTMGLNVQGQLGDGRWVSRSTPMKIAENVAAISAGFYHSLFLAKDGSLWGMGWNGDNQLGVATRRNRNTPAQIIASDVTAISAGSSFSLFTESDGSLWGMGWMGYGPPTSGVGQIGDGMTENKSRPAQIIPIPASATQSLWPPSNSQQLTTADGGMLPKTTQGRLEAMQGFLQKAQVALNAATTDNKGGYVEEGRFEVSQALSDVTAAIAYAKSHPEIDPLNEGLVPADMPKVVPVEIPDYVRLPNGRYGSPRMVDALVALNGAVGEFINGEPGSVGPVLSSIGGYRNRIMQDIGQALSSVVNGMDFARGTLTTPSGATN